MMQPIKDWLRNPRVWLWGVLVVVFVIVVTVLYDSLSLLNMRWILSLLAFAFAAAFIWLFTEPLEGETKPDDKKLQRWIIFSYAFMLFALVVAILPFLRDRDVDPGKVAKRPISVFLGCSKDSDVAKELACSEKERGREVGIPSAPPTQPETGEAQRAADTQAGKKDSAIQRRQWVINIGGRVEQCPTGSKEFCIDGGLVVPLYFVILALIGGAVSLTRRVPEYQKRSASSYTGTEKEPKLNPAQVREYLVFQIVQFISAPFIAVVAYYLVSQDTRTFNVTLGFIAGFSSEAVLLMIRAVVEKIRPPGVPLARTGTTSGVVVDTKKGTGAVNANVTVVGQATLKAQTDPKGHFVIDDIPAGTQVIEASDPNIGTKMAKVTVIAGKATVCHIDLP